MNKKLIIVFSPFLLASTVSVQKDETVPTIQLFSSFSPAPVKKFLNRLPKKLTNRCHIIKVKKYYTLRCITDNVKKDLKLFKKYASDAFYINTKKEAIFPEKKTEKPKINISDLLSKADNYYKNGDIQKSLELYKQAYKHEKSQQTASNISYLEGILGKEPSIITEKTLYAYSIGAIKYNHTAKLKQIIQKNLSLSKSGYLDFVYAYLNENSPKTAMLYYKKAYLKNPINKHFIYGYARILDKNKNYRLARHYYGKISKCNENLCKIAKMRLRQLPQ